MSEVLLPTLGPHRPCCDKAGPGIEVIGLPRVIMGHHRYQDSHHVCIPNEPAIHVQGLLDIHQMHRPYRGTSFIRKNPPPRTTIQGYLGYKVTSARGSVGRRFLILRNPRAKPVGLRFKKIRKRTKAVGPLFS